MTFFFYFSVALGVIASSNDLREQCQKYAVASICHFSYPQCVGNQTTLPPIRLCRDECEMLESEICNLEYTVAKEHGLIGM